jgi:guanylate kinase
MNELKRIAEFRQALSNYQPSDLARALLADIRLVLLVGPSSSGRNTIIRELVNSNQYHFIVSDTTRKPRKNNDILEQNGREYWFRNEDEVLEDLRSGKFLEAAIIHNQQVSGISIRELQTAFDEDKVAINEIENVGADNIHAVAPNARFIFVVPPGFDEWMVRMRGRGQLPPDETRRRLESAVKEISTALKRDYFCFLVNDTYVHAAKHIDDIMTTGEYDPKAEKAAREIAREVLADTEAYLAANK